MAVSTFTWLDHREDDAARVRDALSAFDDKGMVDPLGFGVVRDAFSELLFPGTSTIQTRARYFLLVPWVFASLDDDPSVTPTNGLSEVRERELALCESLLRGSVDHDGIFGRVTRRQTKRLPSFAYWTGLGRWGIRRFDGTTHDYVGSLDSRRRARGRRSIESIDGGVDAVHGAWHPGLPAPPDDLFDAATLDLTPDEGLFLQGRILDSVPRSFLTVLARDGRADDDFDFPWTHPLAESAPDNVRRDLHHAHLFSLTTRGAGLVYNAELSRLLVEDGGEPLEVDYDAELVTWSAEMAAQRETLATWDRREFWHVVATQNGRVPLPVRTFVDWWLDLAIGSADPTSNAVRVELRRREAALKGARAKLANRRARERSPGAQGDGQLWFRWGPARRILRDIHRGVEGHAQPV